jgi:chromosomal replication initiator protein
VEELHARAHDAWKVEVERRMSQHIEDTGTSNSLWDRVLVSLRGELRPLDFDTWISPLVPAGIVDGALLIFAPHEQFCGWVSDQFGQAIQDATTLAAGSPLPIRVQVNGGSTASTNGARSPQLELPMGQAAIGAAEPSRRPRVQPARTEANGIALNPDYTFETFVVGSSNQFGAAACRVAAEKPGRGFNPLFIYGGTGLGKTHLLHAIGNKIAADCPHFRVKYISSEQYINELIQCIRADRMEDFRSRYRSDCDVLLVDDVQFFAGKERTQHEFFHTFNSLYGAQKQIVVTSDRAPQEVRDLEERLRTRFEWGLIADIQPPEIETRVAILEKKAEREGLRLSEDVAMFLATHIRSNVRALEGSLIRVMAYARLVDKPITVRLVRDVLKDQVNDQAKAVTSDQIVRAVASYFDVKIPDLKGPRRHKMITRPRMVAMYLCRKLTEDSYPEIGRSFGDRDHTTVINAVSKVESLLETDPQIQRALRDLRTQLEI